VYADRAAATGGGRPIATSQLAFPKETCDLAYDASGYSASARNLNQVSLQSDNVFGDDGGAHQVASMSGDAGRGFAAFLAVPVER
jgi:hypothetical protein